MKIQSVHSYKKLCYGCGTCSGICKSNAIKMNLTNEGTYLPIIDKKLCTNCSICVKSCPWISFDISDFEKINYGGIADDSLGIYRECYIGHTNNAKLRFESSSGGILSTLLIHLLDKKIIDGALVTKNDINSTLTPVSFIARSKEDILSSIGSKYITVPVNVAIKEILQKEGRYAVVGLPCQIQGLRKAEEINKVLQDRIVLRLGIMCSGTISIKGTHLLLKALNTNIEDMSEIHYRGKGWPGSFHTKLKNGTKTKEILYKDYFSLMRFHLPLYCMACWDHTNELADISFGDAWIPSVKKSKNDGTSLVIVRSKIGEMMLMDAEKNEKISLSKIATQLVINSQAKGIEFKKENLNMRLSLMKLFRKDVPYFRNIKQINEINPKLKLKTLFLFTRYLLMNNGLTSNFIDGILVNILRKKVG